MQNSQRWVEPNQRSVPKQCNNVRSFSGPSLTGHAKFDRPRHPKPRVLARRDFYFNNASIVIVTRRSANEKQSCRPPRLPRVARFAFLTPNFMHLTFFGDSWRQKIIRFFLNIWLFGGSWHMLSHWCFRFLIVLLKSVIRIF